MDQVYFTNSGTEATEFGLKLAWLRGKRQFIAMRGGFHGKTIGALGVMGQSHYRAPFEHLLFDVKFVPFGDSPALEECLKSCGQEACVILEPIQGEAGVIIPPEGYVREVQRLCFDYGAFLILDEIQTGLGRVGTWWAAV